MWEVYVISELVNIFFSRFPMSCEDWPYYYMAARTNCKNQEQRMGALVISLEYLPQGIMVSNLNFL